MLLVFVQWIHNIASKIFLQVGFYLIYFIFSMDSFVDSGCKVVISLSVPIMYTINSVLLSAADEDD